MKYQSKSTVVDGDVRLFRLFGEGKCLTHGEVHQLWREDEKFAQFYSEQLLSAGFTGFCWETPAITAESLDTDHEFVVVRSDSHRRLVANPAPFSEHFQHGAFTVAFPNLGRNGVMIAPTPAKDFEGQSIGAFLSSASDERIADLWSVVGSEVSAQVGANPIWVSTAGLGVSWLHVRIDTRPKYYRYQPYKKLS